MQLLLNSIQHQNDQKAFKQLYQLFFFKLYQFAYSYTRSKESSEELVNDVFLNIWQKRDTLDSIQNINLYLYVSVKNASLNYLRRNSLPVPVSVDDLHADHFQITADPESALISRELQGQVAAAIEQLPSRCKLIFKLVKQDGLSYKEVADLLGISTKTVDSQLCLALKKLAHLLHPVNSW
ncbi:RNA polymerase sigma-70 factor [Pseudobacter ginsenosidimutans]|uniref:RNA polymerase sigma-70 factor (ECF subfamily) n=1 Tax=Pseudobacter ginsenosidimutans TaxID=661488 RepID=A0A4V2F1U9_9BACT|nr:RNA polymerase sigma-70 factor [Pseudobacter ginsenosidimutans]QEC43637.1 RNA polymerase sigma-70 factor [Pseudobacter ginsenosidimutans]RZS75036.1 RNA polymerase sigma-70 factor (ECF subfamily) [Pseudobacter ginsenosidimutans]